MKYKTDLSDFGGDGCRFVAGRPEASLILEVVSQVADGVVLEQVTLRNQLRLLDWK